MKYTSRRPSRAHQQEARDKSRGKPGFGYLMEMGTGKTKVALDEIGELYMEGEIDAVLMLAPKGVYTNWQVEEIPKEWTDDFLDSTTMATWRGGGTVAQRAQINTMFAPDPTLKFFSMNIEGLGASDKAYEIATEFVKRHKCYIAVDESTMIKNPTASRSKAVSKLRDLAPYRRVLCGQPVPNGPMDIYSQLDFCQRGYLGNSFYSFRNKYAVIQKQFFGERGVDVIVGYRDLEELAQRISPITFRKRKNECLDLPPKVYLPPRHVELTPEQARVYREVRDNCTAQLDAESHVTATLALTQMMRLHQVLCGHVVDEEGRIHLLPTNRPRAMLEQCEEMGRGGIIWATYQPDIDIIEETLRKAHGREKVVSFHGRVSDVDRELAKRRFNDGSADWFVATPQSAGRGLTLIRKEHARFGASPTLYYSNSHNLDHRDQSEDRPHRDGQTETCVYQDLMVPGTVEEKIVQALRTKINLATVVLQDGYRKWMV